MPPAWYANAIEGTEHDVNGTKWFVKEVNGPTIWWARTRYGKAEACSVEQKPQYVAPSYNPYGGYSCSQTPTPMQQAYQKALQNQSAGKTAVVLSTPVWNLLSDYADAAEKLSSVKRNPIKSDRLTKPVELDFADDFAFRIGSYWAKRREAIFLEELIKEFGLDETSARSSCSLPSADAYSNEQLEMDH